MAVKNALATLYPKVLSLALDQEALQLKKGARLMCEYLEVSFFFSVNEGSIEDSI